jgi:hypothetical protein
MRLCAIGMRYAYRGVTITFSTSPWSASTNRFLNAVHDHGHRHWLFEHLRPSPPVSALLVGRRNPHCHVANLHIEGYQRGLSVTALLWETLTLTTTLASAEAGWP